MADVLSRPLFRQHYQTGGGVSDLFERGKGMGGAALERGMGMGGTAVEYLMKQGLSLEAAIEELKNNPRLIEALERGEALAGGALEGGRAAIDDPRVRATFERGKGMAGEALERGRSAMERLHGVPPGGFGAGSVNVPPGGFGAGADSIKVPPGGFDGTHSAKNPGGFPRPAMAVEREVGFPRSFDTDHIDSFRNKAGRLAKGLGRFAMNPYVAAASVALPLAYDALTDSPEELLGQLDTQTRAYVEYLMEQGVSIEEALKIAGPSEEAPLERQAGGPVQHFALGGLAALGAGVLALKAAPSALGTGAALLGYHGLTSSVRKQEEALALLPPEQKAQVKALVDQGMSVEEALEAVDASVQEVAPLERQAGGPVMPPQAMMPPPQAAPAGMEALIAQAPEILNQAEGAVSNRMEDVGREYVSNTLSAVDMAEDPEGLINALRGTDAPIEQRYDELAQIVGEQDAEATPPSVLALVQPAIMMTEQGAVDSGIGNLMQEFSSSAEMLTGEGEATPMGEGVGNLMMAGAQPGMEALPPEAMMGPPPGAMRPPQAMMPPPPGGMAYGGPVPRFAHGGPVQHFEWGGGAFREALSTAGDYAAVIDPRTLLNPAGRVFNAARDNASTALGLINNPSIRNLFGSFDYDVPDPTQVSESALTELSPIPYPELKFTGRESASDKLKNYKAADLFTADSLPDLGDKAPMYNARERATKALRDGRIKGRIDPSVFNIPTIAPATVTETEAAVIRDPGRMRYDPSQQGLMVDYDDPERFKKNFEDRFKLYEDVLGSDKDFTKSQMLFDIAGAGLNFAAGRGAGGENVATQSPAAQLAAAFSQVPKTMGERLALQRQEERGVKTAALAATEKEETARRDVVAGERKLKQDLLFNVEKGDFDARNLVGLTQGKFNQEAALQTVEHQLRGELARMSSATDLASIATRGKINAAIGQVEHQYSVIARAATIGGQMKIGLLNANAAVTQTNLSLENSREIARYTTESAGINSYRTDLLRLELGEKQMETDRLAIEQARAIGKDRFVLDLAGVKTEEGRLRLTAQIQSNRDYADASQFDRLQDFKEMLSGRELRMFEQKLAMNRLMATTGQLTREDLLRESAFDRELKNAMGIDDWNKFSYQLDESIRQFDIDNGLQADSIYGTLALKKRVLDQEALEHLQRSTPGVFDNVPGGTQAERDRNIFAMRPLWKRYATGNLAPEQEDYLSALITGYLDPTLNSQGLETRKALPQMVLAALQGREDLGLTMPIQNSMDMDFSGVDADFFGQRAERTQAALRTLDSQRVLP